MFAAIEESEQLELVHFKFTTCFRPDGPRRRKAAGAPQGTGHRAQGGPRGQRRSFCAAAGGRGRGLAGTASPPRHRLPLRLFLCVRRPWWVGGSVLRLVSPAGTRCFLARGCIGLGGTRVAPGPLGGTGGYSLYSGPGSARDGPGRAWRGRGGAGRHGRARGGAPASGASGYSWRAGVIS